MPLDLVGMPGVFDGDESCASKLTTRLDADGPHTDTQQQFKHLHTRHKCTLTTEPCCGR
jgi:hypothetical protein